MMTSRSNTRLFPYAHFWLLIPFTLTIAGFYMTYWSKFSQAPWRQHMHGLTATAWYLLVIVQPWLINNKPASYHKKLGIIGVFLAGGVVLSAAQVIPYQVVNEWLPDILKYGFSFADICALTGFSLCVILGVINARDINVHARWLVATVFWILLPATARLVYFPMLHAYEGDAPLTYLQSAYLCWFITTLIPLVFMMYLDYRKEKKIYAPYVFTLLGVSFYTFTIAPMGKWQWWIDICINIIGKGM
jgi:putative effector of murein hydrolase LrgA (UPF0299 family)